MTDLDLRDAPIISKSLPKSDKSAIERLFLFQQIAPVILKCSNRSAHFAHVIWYKVACY